MDKGVCRLLLFALGIIGLFLLGVGINEGWYGTLNKDTLSGKIVLTFLGSGILVWLYCFPLE